MDDYDNYNDSFEEMQGGFDQDEFPWDNSNQFPIARPMFGNQRSARYNEAYGDYRGGYGPGGGYPPRPRFPNRFGGPGPMGPPPPPLWGRGFGPGGPPFQARRHPGDERAIRYLMRCGVTKENLKNLPGAFLKLIQPEHCGLCAMSFESFTISRMHYISKNHLKNQKKWLSQKSDGGFQRNNREIPLKSRDLYCELCDVHITSKSHAEAHYAGKPHRGIVEGRKNPKNPLLLQRDMADRLEQLIRREKRCLKPVEAKSEVGEPDKEPKIVSTELYCEICKTSVTCTEQMTMHLNGKKHLSKEKQHILKMMKTGSNKDDDNNVEDGDGEGEGEGEEEAEEPEVKEQPAEGEAAAEDWGTEAWDSHEQNQDTAAN